MRKPRLIILRNESPEDHSGWLKACSSLNNEIDFSIVDLTIHNWLELIIDFDPDVCLLKPSGQTSLFRHLYQERVDIIVNDLKIKVYPDFNALRIYENKVFFAYWLEANKIPHPKTWVFYNKKEALKFTADALFPLVAKMNVGASGNGIVILNRFSDSEKYIKEVFGKGVRAFFGPKLSKGKILKRVWRKLSRPSELAERLKTYRNVSLDRQYGFLLFQEYIKHLYEWRAVRIGDSFFAHKKLVKKGRASGSLEKGYEKPPVELLDFIYELTEKHSLFSVAVDLFEIEDEEYLVNEIQCIFGQSDPYQMKIEGKPGRYIRINDKWHFEEGDFNTNGSYDLRLQDALKLIEY